MKQNALTNTDTEQHNHLFLSVADQLSQTFLQLTRLAEEAKLSKADQTRTWEMVHVVSESALLLTDAYVLNERLRHRLQQPEIEPVALSSLFFRIQQRLEPFAKKYNIRLKLADVARLHPVMGDTVVLEAALISLGQVLIMAEAASDTPSSLTLQAYRTSHGIVAGIYTADSGLTTDAFRRARSLHGRSRQPLSKLGSGPAAGVFVANHLLQFIDTKLHVARYNSLTGLGATLPVCKQLQLV